ncbi:MAG: thioredoxin [Holosporaceae bacterium]|jgi:thioredoxin 1|nr:thioredoxin [Holosporaceae bacterium]
MIKTVNEANFDKEVLKKDFVVVDFCADWCGPCRVIGPFLEEISEEHNVEIVKANIDESPNVAAQYGVMSIPSLLIFKNGEKISATVGVAAKTRIVDWIIDHQH